MLFGKERKKESEQLLNRVRELLDPASMVDYNVYIEETANMFINAGEEGTDVLYDCLNDVFTLRGQNMYHLLRLAYKVILHTKDTRLISILEKILKESRNLVKGYPTPLSWMPALHTDIAGGGKYGWSDGTWIPITHTIAEFLLELFPQLPTELQVEHRERLSQAINYHVEEWESVLERSDYKGAVKKDINYWKSLNAKLPNKEV